MTTVRPMQRTLVVLNMMSGNAENVPDEEVIDRYTKGERVDIVRLTSPEQDYDVSLYHKLIVFGGDGTVNNAINKCRDRVIDILYFPAGTLNERAKANRKAKETKRTKRMGTVGGRLFSYVVAVGTFTEIGYITDTGLKKKFKMLAYLAKVFSAYKVHRIRATVEGGEEKQEGEFTLIMVIDSNRCFGFNFNRMYDPESDEMHLLTVKSPGENNLMNKVKIFFPFFRAFFIGFNRPYKSKTMRFERVKRVTVTLDKEYPFCLDGERYDVSGTVAVQKSDLKPRVYIMLR